MPHAYSIVLAERHDADVGAPGSSVLSLCLSGEIDMLAMPELRRALSTAADRRPMALAIDVAAVTFLGLSAMGALLVARTGALGTRADVSLNGASRSLQLLIDRIDRLGLLSAPAAPRS